MILPTGWSLNEVSELWDPSNGPSLDYTYEGPSGAGEATVTAVVAALEAGYSKLTITKKPHGLDGRGTSTVKVSYSTDAGGTVRPPTDPDYGLVARTWTKHTNKHQLSLLGHPTAKVCSDVNIDWPARIRTAAITYRRALDSYYEGTLTTEPVAADFIEKTITAFSSKTVDQQDTALWLFSEFLADENATWSWDQPVLRKTEVVITETVLEASHANVGRIHNTTALGNAEGTLALAVIINTAGLSAWYWLKGSPDVDQASGGRFQIVQEWEGVPVITAHTTKRYGATLTS